MLECLDELAVASKLMSDQKVRVPWCWRPRSDPLGRNRWRASRTSTTIASASTFSRWTTNVRAHTSWLQRSRAATCLIAPPVTAEEFKMMVSYVKNTHGATHTRRAAALKINSD
jgi:hypothetical protein